MKISYNSRKKLLDKVQFYGLMGLGWVLRGLTRILFGAETWRGFSALSTTEWIRKSARYSLPYSTIKGIDQALKDSLSPEEALDRLARKAGISKKVIKASKILCVEPTPDIPTDAEILAKREALKTAIRDSLGRA